LLQHGDKRVLARLYHHADIEDLSSEVSDCASSALAGHSNAIKRSLRGIERNGSLGRFNLNPVKGFGNDRIVGRCFLGTGSHSSGSGAKLLNCRLSFGGFGYDGVQSRSNRLQA
jgi:hypothetical protein